MVDALKDVEEVIRKVQEVEIRDLEVTTTKEEVHKTLQKAARNDYEITTEAVKGSHLSSYLQALHGKSLVTREKSVSAL